MLSRYASTSLKLSTLHFPRFSSNFFGTSTTRNCVAIAPRTGARRTRTSRSAPVPRALDTVALTNVVNSVCSLLAKEKHRTTNLDRLFERSNARLSSDLVLRILMNHKVFGGVKALEFFSWSGLKMGFRFDESVVEYMAYFLGKRKLFDDMKCLLLTVSSRKGRISCRTFSICIRLLGREGKVREALCLFEEMERKFGCKPDSLVFNNLLHALCTNEATGELIDVAVTIFRRIALPDRYSYSDIIMGLCKFSRFRTAVEVFGDMERAGLVPTRRALSTLVGDLCSLSAKEGAIGKVRYRSRIKYKCFTVLVPNVCSKSGSIEPAVGVFRAAKRMGLVPSSPVMVQFISELCRLGQMQEAIGVLKAVENGKLRCAEECISIVIHALCENRQVEEASDLLGRMISQGMEPKLAVYNSVISMLCRVGNLVDAEGVLKIMDRKGCLPDHDTYSALLRGYGRLGDWSTAHSILEEMLSLGMAPHMHLYTLVEKLMRVHGQFDLHSKLQKKWEAHRVQKLCKDGELEAAYEKVESMIEKGIDPPIYVRDAFEKAFEKKGKLKMALELLEKIQVHKHEK